MTRFKVRLERGAGDRVRVGFFVGEDGTTLQHVGELLLHVGEWQLLGATLSMGAARAAGHMRFEVEGEHEALR